MQTKTLTTMMLLALTAGTTLAGEIKTRTAWITLPDGGRMHCFAIEGPNGSTTSCRPIHTRNRVATAHHVHADILIAPEAEAAWDIAYKYLKRARTRKGWKAKVKGPLGDLLITPSAVSLDGKAVPRSAWEVESAIWHLTQSRLGIKAS